ncbi:phage baseplate assembly protein domain-containing protein [Roseomonas xinghualingensis]|uniref:phage baseplate assembly protein domain-containing protein n=1 Tax=Roseomonas xinghualingensis TaxID=2986475 RepID=UPI0021F15553|nr:phage baseplate assembly protein [Roseomonas sp. SXEYE001]MCV4206926.1 phage baseplate assembly protein [Roseomonas sp. SXEYE001]
MSSEISRLYGRLMSLVGIARISASQALGGRGIRRYQARFEADEVRDNTQAVQQYGFASRALRGADGVVVFLGGNRASGIIIATNDRRHQVELAEGEVVIHDDQGQKVHLTRAGIVVDGGGKPVTIQNTPRVTADTPEWHVTGKISAAGDIESSGTVKATTDVMVGSRTLLQHRHSNGNQGGLTGTPV